MEIFENLTLQNIDYSIEHLVKGEYEGCKFINCNFCNGFNVYLPGHCSLVTGYFIC